MECAAYISGITSMEPIAARPMALNSQSRLSEPNKQLTQLTVHFYGVDHRSIHTLTMIAVYSLCCYNIGEHKA